MQLTGTFAFTNAGLVYPFALFRLSRFRLALPTHAYSVTRRRNVWRTPGTVGRSAPSSAATST